MLYITSLSKPSLQYRDLPFPSGPTLISARVLWFDRILLLLLWLALLADHDSILVFLLFVLIMHYSSICIWQY